MKRRSGQRAFGHFLLAIVAATFSELPARIFAADPPAAHADRYGDPLPEHAVARLGTVRFRPAHGAWAIAISPDGSRVATGSDPGTSGGLVEIWDTSNGQMTGRLVVDTDMILALEWSPDGRRIAVSGGKWVEVVNPESMKSIRRFTNPVQTKVSNLRFWSVRWSPSSHQIAAVNLADNGVYLLDAESLTVLKTWNYPQPVYAAAFSTDGKQLAIGGNNVLEVRVIDPFAGKLSMTNIPEKVRSVAFSPDGKNVAAAADPTDGTKGPVRLWNAATGEHVATLEPRGVLCDGLAYSADGKTLVYGGDDGVCIWDIAGNRLRARLSAAGANRRHFSMTPDGRFLAAGEHRIVIWDVAEARQIGGKTDANGSVVFGAACLPDGKRVASAGGDGQIRYWELSTGKLLQTIVGTKRKYGILSLAIARDGRTLATGDSAGTISLWTADSGDSLGRLPSLEQANNIPRSINALDFSPGNDILASGDFSSAVTLWSVKERRAVQSHDTDNMVSRVRFSPDGKLLASSAFMKPVRIWNASESKEVKIIPASKGDFFVPFDFGADSRSIFAQGFPKESAAGQSGPAQKQDQRVLRLLNCYSGDEIWSSIPTEPIGMIALSPNGRLVATSAAYNGDGIQFWSARTGKLLFEVKGGHTGTIRALAFTPDSTRLVSGSQDTTLLVWDITHALKLADAEQAGKKQ